MSTRQSSCSGAPASSTSTNVATNGSLGGTSSPESNPSTSIGSPTSSNAPTPVSPARRPVMMNLARFFQTGNKPERSAGADLVTPEGSVKKEAWTLMGKGNTNKTRVRTLANLQDLTSAGVCQTECRLASSPTPARTHFASSLFRIPRMFEVRVMKNKSLQVSTLEGIWHETKDMLGESETREPTLRAIIELTKTQYSQLGLALRHTFFEKIKDLGCEEKTLKWLDNLTDEGKNIDGFEKSMDFLMANWVHEVLGQHDHPQATKVLQLTLELVKRHSSYCAEVSIINIIRAVCKRCSRISDALSAPCLQLLATIVLFSDVPHTELDRLVTTLCLLVTQDNYEKESWKLARTLLMGKLGHRTRNILLNMLDKSVVNLRDEQTDTVKAKRSLKGAVYFLAQSTWGVQKVENNISPAFVIPSFENAVGADPELCNTILLSMKRLVVKYGKDLQHLSWRRIVHFLHHVHELYMSGEGYNECRKLLEMLLDHMETLMLESHYTGSSGELVELIEQCIDCRKPHSKINLMQYREREISHLTPDWIAKARSLVEQFLCKEWRRSANEVVVRKAAVEMLRRFYVNFRSLSEHEMVTELLLPTLTRFIPVEEDCDVQYQMGLALFDITKQMPIRCGQSSALFDKVLGVIRRMFIDGLSNCFPTESDAFVGLDNKRDWGGFCLDNMGVVAKALEDVVDERWSSLPSGPLLYIVDMMTVHIRQQYDLGQFGLAGGDVRADLFRILFSIRCCPLTRRMMRRKEEDGEEPELKLNYFVRLLDGKDGSFTWEDIASIVTSALIRERYWPVIAAIINGLSHVLEYPKMIRSSGEKQLERLVEALILLKNRSAEQFIFNDTAEEEEGWKQLTRLSQLPGVLATLLNYTQKWDNRTLVICKELVSFVQSGTEEDKSMGGEKEEWKRTHVVDRAILACSLALLRSPQVMSTCAHVLVATLNELNPTPERAIPIIELLSDAALVPQFSLLFQEKQYKWIVDILSSFYLLSQYNPFVVVAAQRTLMLWFSRVPEAEKPLIQDYIFERIGNIKFYHYTSQLSRNPSGDGRQEMMAYELGGPPDTPPPMDCLPPLRNEDFIGSTMEELLMALKSFFISGRIDDLHETENPHEGFYEVSHLHYFVGDEILSVRTLQDRAAEQDDDTFLSGSQNNFEGDLHPKCRTRSGTTAADDSRFGEQRKRHQSAAQPLRSNHAEGRRALDDSQVDGRKERSFTFSRTMPLVTYSRISSRTMYGKLAFDLSNANKEHHQFEPFFASTSSSSAASLLSLLALRSQHRCSIKKHDEKFAGSLRNLDRHKAVEFHAVGVYYQGPGQKDEKQQLPNIYGSDRFNRFIRNLGTLRSLTMEPGGLLPGMHGKYTYEYRNETSHIVFLVASLMPNSVADPDCNQKRKLIGNNYVSVVFNESGTPQPTKPVHSYIQTIIELTPVDEESVMVDIHSKKEVALWLGLRKALVTDEAAATIVRQVAMRAQLASTMHKEPERNYLGSGVERLRLIRKMKKTYASAAPSIRE